ncbi:tetratricopeptide repeat protein [Tautonia sociabilis]|uniref:Tetratricopeptide repeat protein n=1 Tax=Tautonia sociabilis TaxID=2080755 RepID=A0A432MN70_9BACT|nr:tetratricopeptide repeat protein [Tautonia sociabilis]RUL88883.1 tetratricopeptide repeat protein [Tautonia sociabilis]
MRRHLAFLEGLRDRGYFDLADDYLDRLRDDPQLPEGIAPLLAFERGRGKIEESQVAQDLERRDLLLDQARSAFDAFLREYPTHELAPEAKVQLAQVLYQRGQTAALKADEAERPEERDTLLAAARAAFAQAKASFDQALIDLRNAYEAFPAGFIEESDPTHALREEAQRRLIDATLKRALIDYDEAQTYPEGSEERGKLLDSAATAFKNIYDSYRTWMAGFAARMWQGKSLEENGEIGSAMGIYNELLGHDDPRLTQLQRQVAFFKVIAHRKREEYPLAERLAREWLALSRGDTGSYERLGVQLELAKNIDAMLEAEYGPAVSNKENLVKDLVQQLSEVVRYASPYKAEAVDLLRKYRPGSTIDPRSLAGLSFDQAMERAREEMGLRSWENAIVLFQAALSKANPSRDPSRANEARYLLAFCLYSTRRYHEAAVLADFLARRYPEWDSSLGAAELGMGALAMAYESVGGPGQAEDLARLRSLAHYTIATWPDAAQADVARILLGDVALGQGRYAEAAEAFESVKTPAHALEARGKAAAAHWRRSLLLRKEAGEGPVPPEARAEADRALELLRSAYDERVESRVPPTDPERLRNAGDLAEILLAESRPEDALAVLDPHVEAMATATLNSVTRPLSSRLLRLRLQAHITQGQTEEALADMNALESVETDEPLTQLFFGLGRVLEAEMEAQRQAGDIARLNASRDAFQKFLDALIESRSGQSYASLQWAGEQMLALERPGRAVEIFRRVLEEFPENPGLLRTRLKLSAAYRQDHKFKEAWSIAAKLVAEHPRGLDFLIEQCQILEDWAEVEPGYWNVAIRHWQDLAKKLEGTRPRPPEYYECWYHVALCQLGKGSSDAARRTLKSVMALSETLGSPEIKQKYEQLLRQVGG